MSLCSLYVFICFWNWRGFIIWSGTLKSRACDVSFEQFGLEAHCIQCTVKVKRSRRRPGVAQRVGRGIALLFHDRGTRRGWVVSSTPRPHFTPGKDQVPILQEDGWAPGPVWMGGKSRPRRDLILDRPARSQSLYWLSYPAHIQCIVCSKNPWSYIYIYISPTACKVTPGI